MLGSAPRDNRLLLERPLPEAFRFYAGQVGGLILLCFFLCACLVTVVVGEHLLGLSHAATPLTSKVATDSVSGFLTGAFIGAVLSTTAAIIANIWRRNIRRKHEGAWTAVHDLEASTKAYQGRDLVKAKEYALASLGRFEKAHHRSGVAASTFVLGLLYSDFDDIDTAFSSLYQARQLYGIIGDREGAARCLWALGETAARRERYAEAEEFYRQSSDVYRELGNATEVSVLLVKRATIAEEQGDTAKAALLRQEVVHTLEQGAMTWGTDEGAARNAKVHLMREAVLAG